MKRTYLLIISTFCSLLSGCGHTQWVSLKDNTYLAGWVNPVGFAVHMVASVGELASRPSATADAMKVVATE